MAGLILALAPVLRAAILAAADRAFPQECCGLVEGVDTADGWRALALHETANLAENPARHFLVDPQAQFTLMKRLRDSERRLIGCFHSHPGGPEGPSESDRAGAAEDGFLWLIAAGTKAGGFALSAHVYEAGRERFLSVALAP